MMVECDVKPGESETLRSMRERHNSMVHTSVTTTPWCGDTVFILIGTLIIIMLTQEVRKTSTSQDNTTQNKCVEFLLQIIV